MNRCKKESARMLFAHEPPQASSYRVKGKKRNRRDAEPMGSVRQLDMTPEQWRAYHEGPKPGKEDIQRLPAGLGSFGGRMGCKASELGLKPGDWDDPRYREIYKHVVIYRDDVEIEEKEPLKLSPELSDDEFHDPDWDIVFVGPGSNSLAALVTFLARFEGKDLQMMSAYDPEYGYAAVRATERMRRFMRQRGFEVDEFKLELDDATD